MPNNTLPVLSDGLFPARYENRLARATSREIALTRAHEYIAIAKIEAVATTGRVALAEVSGLSLSELAHAQQNPHAATRLKFTADTTTMAINRRIEQLERDLR